MDGWSAENATNAYLRSIKMGKRANEPDTAEFISALVAGTNARLMVVACAGAADFAVLALVAAAHQTGGEVVCIVGGPHQVQLSKESLGESGGQVKFVIGNAEDVVRSDYREADCVVVDCRISNSEGILRSAKGNGGMVLGYNALQLQGVVDFDDAHFLPIGEGLLVSRKRWRRRWVVKVDKFTGEEHVFRVTN
ncbi:hypothetical protein ACS0TY_001322 [Phlomoides rotata]